MSRDDESGIALVLVGGLLALFLSLATVFFAAADGSRLFGRGVLDGARAALTAESGMGYAAARLAQDPYPSYRDTSATRPDSWVSREPPETPLERMRNVAYGRGEPWRDTVDLSGDGLDNDRDGRLDEPGEGTGLYTPGEPFLDLDGDGRYSAWSGRLRSCGGRFEERFSLVIESPDGKIPVNAGYLDALDRQPYPFLFGGSWGIPDHRDPGASPYHKGLVHVLNNLGAVTRPGGGTRRRDYPTGTPPGSGHTFAFSWLGEDLVAHRPVGGYRSLKEIRETLLGLGYAPAECDLFLPFLDVGPYAGPVEGGRVSYAINPPWPPTGGEGSDPSVFPPSPPIVLSAAPREVLVSLWRYLVSTQNLPYSAPGSPPLQRVYGEPSGDLATASRTGGTPVRFRTDDFWAYHFMIFPDEADLLADRAASLRADGPVSWQDFYGEIVGEAPALFAADWQDLGGGVSPHPAYQRAWLQAKVDLAFRAVALDAPPVAGFFHGIATWAGWGIDREPATPPVEQMSGVGLDWIFHGPIPPGEGAPLESRPFDGDFPTIYSRRIKPQPLTLTPPVRFRIGCLGLAGGVRRRAEADLRTAEPLYFSSQEDFEVLLGNPFLEKECAVRTVLDDPLPEDRRVRMSDGGRFYPHLVSLPRTNRRSAYDPAAASLYPAQGYSRLYGALSLAPREAGRRDARLYWAFPEDFDGARNAPGTDDWHEADPAYPAPPAWPMQVSDFPTDFWPEFDRYRSPFHVDGSSPNFQSFQCPGMDGPPGMPLEGFSADFWFNLAYPLAESRSLFVVRDPEAGQSGYMNQHFVRLNIARGDPAQPGKRPHDAVFSLSVNAKDELDIPRASASPSWLVRSPGPASPEASGIFHVALSVEHEPAIGETVFRLFVNGSGFAEGGASMTHVHTHSIAVKDKESLWISCVDELRLYDRPLAVGEPAALHAMDRFVRHGMYRSPVYVLETPGRFDRCQWLGLVPPGLRDAAGAPIAPFRILVEGYRTAPGDPGHPALAWSAILGPSGSVDILPPAPVRSFRYVVHILCDAAGVALEDSPVFESVWFTLRRPGRAPTWKEWR